jgi:hypothetical protein
MGTNSYGATVINTSRLMKKFTKMMHLCMLGEGEVRVLQ